MATARVRLGELLVEAQIITREQLEEMLAHQKTDGRRIGTLLVESGLVTETQVTQILSQQLSVPWVSLYHIDFSRQLLNLVPRDIAEKYCLVPIFVRRVRGLGETLYVAMDDPSDENAQKDVSQYSGLPVRSMIAPPSDIQAAIRVYYDQGESLRRDEAAQPARVATPPDGAAARAALKQRSDPKASTAPAAVVAAVDTLDDPRSSDTPPSVPIAKSRAASVRPAEHGALTASKEAPVAIASSPAAPPAVSGPESIARDSSPQIEAREISMPAPRRGKRARMISLTLLDGTQVNLPARGKLGSKPDAAPQSAKSEVSDAEQLTARDLIAALRAVSHGADATEILGQNARWEALFAALLSVLLKKHLIADWEFVDEYKKV
jgi:type IV pilus assembly protein PilB